MRSSLLKGPSLQPVSRANYEVVLKPSCEALGGDGVCTGGPAPLLTSLHLTWRPKAVGRSSERTRGRVPGREMACAPLTQSMPGRLAWHALGK